MDRYELLRAQSMWAGTRREWGMGEVQRRREHIIGRRMEGWTLVQIGQELGISRAQVGRLYQLGMKDREKRKSAEARAEARLGTSVHDLGLPSELVNALVQMGCTDLCSAITQDEDRFLRQVLGYPNVTRRSLVPLNELRSRFG
jgi:hypothetical protein